MRKTIVALSSEQQEKLISDFLFKLGERLRIKREKAGLTQKELASCTSENNTAISRYENGERDMNVSLLPLYSVYCDFPLSELFPQNESRELLKTFATAVNIIADRTKRYSDYRETKDSKAENKVLKAHIFEIDGKEVIEPISSIKKKDHKSLRERVKEAEINTEFEPFTHIEFCNYMTTTQPEKVDIIIDAGKLLEQIKDLPNKSLKEALADYIIDEIMTNDMLSKESRDSVKRVYEYYKRMYNAISDSNWYPDGLDDLFQEYKM